MSVLDHHLIQLTKARKEVSLGDQNRALITLLLKGLSCSTTDTPPHIILAFVGVFLCALIPGWFGFILSAVCGGAFGYHLCELDKATRRGV